jgi:hypothetical protein
LITIGETLKEGFDGQWIWHSLTVIWLILSISALEGRSTRRVGGFEGSVTFWYSLLVAISCWLNFEGLKLFNLQVQPGNNNETMWFWLLWASQRHVSCGLQMVNWMDWWR